MSKLVMGYWDCPVCGTKEIRGDVANCPSCGRARGDVQFYMKGYNEGETREEDERSDVEYLDEEQAKYVSKNPDWYCSFCNSLNSDNAKFCNNCGSSREDSESNYFQMLQKKKEREAAEAAAQPQVSAPQAKRRSPMTVFLVILLAIVAFFVWMNGNKTSGDLTVTGLQWVRNINIEENKMFSESGWTLPEGAEQTDARNEIHHYDSVLDHYESVEVQRSRQVVDHYETYYTYSDNGNGTFTEVPHERPETEPSPKFPTSVRFIRQNTILKPFSSPSTSRFPGIRQSTTITSGAGPRPGMLPPPARITTLPGRKWSSEKTSGKDSGLKHMPSPWNTAKRKSPLKPTHSRKATG